MPPTPSPPSPRRLRQSPGAGMPVASPYRADLRLLSRCRSIPHDISRHTGACFKSPRQSVDALAVPWKPIRPSLVSATLGRLCDFHSDRTPLFRSRWEGLIHITNDRQSVPGTVTAGPTVNRFLIHAHTGPANSPTVRRPSARMGPAPRCPTSTRIPLRTVPAWPSPAPPCPGDLIRA